MQRVTIQLSTIVVALAFGMVTFAQEPAPLVPPAAPMTSAPSAAPATGSEMKGEGEKHQGKADRKAEKQRRKAEKKAAKEKRKVEKKAAKEADKP